MYDLRYNPHDGLVLDFKLDAETAASIPDCVWAAVVKDQLVTIKSERWDLVSFVPRSQLTINLCVTDVYPHSRPCRTSTYALSDD